MQENISYIRIILLTFFFIYSTSAQVFNIDDYQDFLSQHQDMSTEELLSMHPAVNFLDNISTNYEDALYFDSIDIKYNLTEFEKSLISKNGFVVSERLNKISFGQAILEIFNNDLPVFVSTDAILHAFHVSYDRILQDMEIGLLEPKLIELLNGLRSSMQQLHDRYSSNPEMMKLHDRYSSNPEMMTMLMDVDVYLTVPLILMQQTTSPYYQENTALVNDVLSWIEAEEADTNVLFYSNCRNYDWSQFKPKRALFL